ncbi:unnamed protein product [Closterium sp. Yama58-4]|nr:unnamed protein product [Closterium sp. Yama58-4]
MLRGAADARKSTGGSAGADPSARGGAGADPSTGYGALFRLALPSILLQSGAPLAITVQTALLGRKDTQLVAAWAVVARHVARAGGMGIRARGMGARNARAGHGDARAGRRDARVGHRDARAGQGKRAGHRDARMGHRDARMGHGDGRRGMGMRARGVGMRARGVGMRGRGDAHVGPGDAREWQGMRARGMEMRARGIVMRAWGMGMPGGAWGCARGAWGRARGAGMRARGVYARAGRGDARAGRGVARAGRGVARAGRGYARAGHGDARMRHGDARMGHGDARVVPTAGSVAFSLPPPHFSKLLSFSLLHCPHSCHQSGSSGAVGAGGGTDPPGVRHGSRHQCTGRGCTKGLLWAPTGCPQMPYYLPSTCVPLLCIFPAGHQSGSSVGMGAGGGANPPRIPHGSTHQCSGRGAAAVLAGCCLCADVHPTTPSLCFPSAVRVSELLLLQVTKVVAVGAWAQVGVRIRLAFAMALATSAVAVALLLSSQGLLWALLRDSPSVLQYAKSYFYLRVMGVPPQLLVMCTSGVLQGYKVRISTRYEASGTHPLPFPPHFSPSPSIQFSQHVALVAWLQAARALLDVAASYLSLYVLDWGIVGVGIGTFLASCTVAAVSFACILLLPPPQGRGKIVVFPPILSFLAGKVAVPQVLLCRALSQRVSRTCSKVRVGGSAALGDAQVFLLDGREREGAGEEVGIIEMRVLEVLEGRMSKAGGGLVSAREDDHWPDECGRGDEVGERDEPASRVGGWEDMLVSGDGRDMRVSGDGRDMRVSGDGRDMREGGCEESVEVRVVVGREESSAMLFSKSGKEESVEKGGSGGSEVGERRGGENGEGAEGKCKAEAMEEERINEVLNESTWTFLWDGLSTILRSTLVQLSFFLVLACATSLGVHAVAAHQILMQLWMVNIYIADGFATAGTIVASSLAGRMAQAHTRGEHAALLADLRLVCWRVLRMGLIAGILICAAYTSLERHIVALFTYDEATKAQLRHVWLLLAFMQPLNAVVFVYDGLIYAAQAFSYMAACLAVGFFTLFLPAVCKCLSHPFLCASLLLAIPAVPNSPSSPSVRFSPFFPFLYSPLSIHLFHFTCFPLFSSSPPPFPSPLQPLQFSQAPYHQFPCLFHILLSPPSSPAHAMH